MVIWAAAMKLGDEHSLASLSPTVEPIYRPLAAPPVDVDEGSESEGSEPLLAGKVSSVAGRAAPAWNAYGRE